MQAEVWKSGSLAKTYLESVRGGVPFGVQQIEVMLRIIEAGSRPVERFADLGCGGGILTRSLLHRYPEAVGALVDFSEPMLYEARNHLQAYASQLHFILTDLGDAAWVSSVSNHAPFDAVVSGYAIHHQPDEKKQRLYREIYGLLKPGGFFINIEHVSSSTRWLESVWDNCLIDSLYAFHTGQGTGKSREQVASEYVHRPDKQANVLAPLETQCRWLRDCGFEDVDCFFKIFELAVFGGRRPEQQE